MSCSDPSCSLFVKTETPYRTSAAMPEEPKEEIKMEPKKPSKILKALGFTGKMVLGSVLLTAIVAGLYATYWVLFPGMFRVGVHVSDYLGWDIAHAKGLNDNGHEGGLWFVGISAFIVPVLGGLAVYHLGNKVYGAIQRKIQK